ncbi:MAG: hypothetical protein MZV65_35545 [Chromatiales bacterium]|nr:hypothetical protein [Chromatiales bacterium]
MTGSPTGCRPRPRWLIDSAGRRRTPGAVRAHGMGADGAQPVRRAVDAGVAGFQAGAPMARLALALALGSARLLRDRARDYANTRVQFRGELKDADGRETIAKFGAVKDMLAGIERYLVLLERARADVDTAPHAVLTLARNAMGPWMDAIPWMAGQIFGGMAFSEEEVFAPRYRDAVLISQWPAPRALAGEHSDFERQLLARAATTLEPVRAHSLAAATEYREALAVAAGAAVRRRRRPPTRPPAAGMAHAQVPLPQRRVPERSAAGPRTGAHPRALPARPAAAQDALPGAAAAALRFQEPRSRAQLRPLHRQPARRARGRHRTAARLQRVRDRGAGGARRQGLEQGPVLGAEHPHHGPQGHLGGPAGHGLDLDRHHAGDARAGEGPARAARGARSLPQRLRRLGAVARRSRRVDRHAGPPAAERVQGGDGGLGPAHPENVPVPGFDAQIPARNYLLAMQKAVATARKRDLARLGGELERLRAGLDPLQAAFHEELAALPARQRAHENFLRFLGCGQISAFALTEPGAGSDTGGIQTRAELREVEAARDARTGFYRFTPHGGDGERVLLDAARLRFRGRVPNYELPDGTLAVLDDSGFDLKTQSGERAVRAGNQRHVFHDIGIVVERAGRTLYRYYELTGAKMWITNGSVCDRYSLYAQSADGELGLMLERRSEGLRIGPNEHKLGQRASPTNELNFDRVRVSADQLIGYRGHGQVNALETLSVGRGGLVMGCATLADRLLHDYAEEWKQEPALHAQAQAEYERIQTLAARLMGLMDRVDLTQGDFRIEAALSKYLASEGLHRILMWFERLHGPMSAAREEPIEKWRRDIRILQYLRGHQRGAAFPGAQGPAEPAQGIGGRACGRPGARGGAHQLPRLRRATPQGARRRGVAGPRPAVALVPGGRVGGAAVRVVRTARAGACAGRARRPGRRAPARRAARPSRQPVAARAGAGAAGARGFRPDRCARPASGRRRPAHRPRAARSRRAGGAVAGVRRGDRRRVVRAAAQPLRAARRPACLERLARTGCGGGARPPARLGRPGTGTDGDRAGVRAARGRRPAAAPQGGRCARAARRRAGRRPGRYRGAGATARQPLPAVPAHRARHQRRCRRSRVRGRTGGAHRQHPVHRHHRRRRAPARAVGRDRGDGAPVRRRPARREFRLGDQTVRPQRRVHGACMAGGAGNTDRQRDCRGRGAAVAASAAARRGRRDSGGVRDPGRGRPVAGGAVRCQRPRRAARRPPCARGTAGGRHRVGGAAGTAGAGRCTGGAAADPRPRG